MTASIQKFSPARLPRDLIQRPRLESTLLDGINNRARLFLISAPAGYGKSTLIASWLANNPIEHVWINLEGKDDHLPTFITALRQALGMVVKAESDKANQVTDEAALINALVENIQQRRKIFLLIFDRLDETNNQQIQEFIFRLTNQLNPQAAVVLISRRIPALQVSRMRAHNQLVEIGARELRFNTAETRDFLEQTSGAAFPASYMETLYRKVQGWPAGLRLAIDLLDSTFSNGDRSSLKLLNGSQRYIADYFDEEVFVRLEAAIQDFLVRSSTLDQFSSELCRRAVKGRGTDALIQQVQEENLFLFPLEGKPGWFAYHPLFKDFLAAKSNADERQEILAKAADWYRQQGLLNEAVTCVLQTGQESAALEIIEPACEQAILAGDISVINEWLAEWSRRGFAPRSELLAIAGWLKALEGDFAQALILADQAEDMLKKPPKGKSKAEQASIQVTQGKLAALKAFTDVMYTRQYNNALKQAKTAQRLLPKNNSAWNLMAMWAQAETQKRLDTISKSIETLYDALRLGKSMGGKTFYYAIVNSLAAALHFNGQRAEAVEVCQQALQRSSNPDDPGLGGIYAWLGRLALEANQLDKAQQLVEKGLALTQQSGANLNLIFTYYYASQVYQAQDNPAQALEAIHAAQQLAGKASLSDESWLNAWETNLHLSEGNTLQVEHWMRREGLNLNQKPDYLNMEALLVYTRYLIKNGDGSAAAKLLREMEKQSARRGYYRWLLNIYLQQAIIWEQSGKHSQALDCVKRALRIAAPEEYQRVFLDELSPALKLVPELSAETPAFVMRLLRSASTQEKNGRKIPPSILPEALSPRELEVLKLLADGFKGPQIADELFISYSTVRTHLKSMHRKLDVHSRQELLDKARLLELI